MEELNFNSMATDQRVVATLMRNVYLWMTLALAITGLTAYVTAGSATIMTSLFSNNWLWIGLVILTFVLVMVFTTCINRLSFTGATLIFIIYSLLNGVTFSSIFIVYTQESISKVFFITAGMFAAMALIGSFTKKDLSGLGRFLLMALIGLIIAMVVNMFLHSDTFDFVVSAIGVLLFTILTAYDAQKIKNMLNAYGVEENESTQKIALLGSLTLYLDFINLFLDLLRIFGKNK